MVNWWLDKGVDGFRMDVINYISKEEGLPQGNEVIGQMMGYYGIEHYYYGPKLHQFLHEIHEKAFAPHDAFSVGETPGIGMKMCQLVTGEERKELDMVFSFEHMGCDDLGLKWFKTRLSPRKLMKTLVKWQTGLDWNTNYFENHDQPDLLYGNI